MIEKAMFVVSIDEDAKLRLELFDAACATILQPLISTNALSPLGLNHFRVTVTDQSARIYVDGMLEAERELTAPVCLDADTVELRLGGVQRSNDANRSDFAAFVRFSGIVDEFRLSKIARDGD